MTWAPVLALLGRLVVETGSPDALCPDLASAEDAIHARLGELEARDAANWRLRYTIGHAPDAASGDFVRLELYDAEGALRLSRDLPLAGESCATVARAMALVVDRFFRALVAEQRTESGPAPPPPEPPARPTISASPRSTSWLTARVGLLTPPFSPTLGVGYALRTPYRFSFAAELSWVVATATEELAAGGRAESRSALARIAPAWDIPLGGAGVALGPTLAVAGERGMTSGLPESDTEYRMVAAVGAQASLRLRLGQLGVELTGGAEAPFRPFGGAFVVSGEEVLEPPELRAFVAIGVGPVW